MSAEKEDDPLMAAVRRAPKMSPEESARMRRLMTFTETPEDRAVELAILQARKIRRALRNRIIPAYGPNDPGDSHEEWRACVRVHVTDATDEQIDEALRDAVLEGLIWWDGAEYRRAFPEAHDAH